MNSASDLAARHLKVRVKAGFASRSGVGGFFNNAPNIDRRNGEENDAKNGQKERATPGHIRICFPLSNDLWGSVPAGESGSLFCICTKSSQSASCTKCRPRAELEAAKRPQFF